MALEEQLQKYGLSFQDLQNHQGLTEVDTLFQQFLPDETLQSLLQWRRGELNFTAIEESEFQILLGQYLNGFIAKLFGIEKESQKLEERAAQYNRLMRFKEQFIQRGAKRYRQAIEGDFATHHAALLAKMGVSDEDPNLEAKIAEYALSLDAEKNASEIEALYQWGSLAESDPVGAERVADWMTFKFPARLDYDHLVSTKEETFQGIPVKVGTHSLRKRDGFALTDQRMNRYEVASEIEYCKYCHDHDGDFCSTGFPVKKGDPAQGFRKNPFGAALTGCPLDEMISEMQRLEKEGLSIGSLAITMVENPMVPATGHRICNDCMKSCIYQRQEPVNIPQIETSVLSTVLDLPYGVEIYNLLARWNPLKPTDYLPAKENNRKVLVAGMGPAGFTMAHYLSQQGCYVVGIDGLKIEPLPQELLTAPIKSWAELEENLGDRILAGFGGVAEYGITVRWDKNFLKLIYLTLARRENVDIYGGVRLGGTLTLDDAFDLGFDHVSLAVGAGLPRVLKIENSLAKGMKQASDFLMAMQLTGAAKDSSIANLQVRLPAVVIGGGLTAIDTATEVQAYYIKQVEKALHRVEILGEEKVRENLSPEDNETLTEFLTHGREVRAERTRAAEAGEAPDFNPLLAKWGGVMVAYRRKMQESPAYTLNHEEITKAFEEGIHFGEELNPLGVELDQYGHVKAIRFMKSGETEVTVPARAVLVAAGTSPNTIYGTEYPGSLEIEEKHHFQGYDLEGNLVPFEWGTNNKEAFAPFTSFRRGEKRVSYIGDTHPVFNGNVVKAIASAKKTSKFVMEALARLPENTLGNESLATTMNEGLVATIESIDSSNPTVCEVWVKAPMAAKNFKPGQFFRMQTFETGSEIVAGTRLQIPLLTVSGTGSTEDAIRLLVFQWGTGQRLIPSLKPGDQVILAGPTGAPTDLPSGKTILVVAGKWGAAVMLDIGSALRNAGNKVIYLAAMGSKDDVDQMDALEEGADQIIWAVGKGEPIEARRPQDHSVVEWDVIKLIKELDDQGIVEMKAVDRLMAMGSTGMLKGFQKELSEGGSLYDRFKEDLHITGTIGSPMQCMMKGVCGQCLQWQIDPVTKERTQAVFTCSQQDQPLKNVDLDNLTARTSQNRLPDIISSHWLSYVLAEKSKQQES
ncbi:pyridine nucleotide-disulfide oxidoreductase [Ignatzschineria ureiclastica]|uniref:Pyridine nucleotide-disulfide oxidoreductase n=1 Tax=Ignatzschineria ureiclastica TaxID=472582 RepID=A0A2U2AEH6_9GAMM|nr:FAD-dependent oxidoreductase [Ignatzschineria ureiclastica]PWD81027.1 pyridine nucleotide-disulfide oxidoreductase [Ignatzschineria ureiclastica]GGZ93149.1 pyridine nucleotide-disulfide oxidoreductase [Ignatzschineria ureiclastica]